MEGYISDDKLPLAQMLPGSNLCELRLFLKDSKIGTDGFHDVVMENLSGSLTWRSSHVMPADVTAMRRRWLRAVFRTMQKRAKEVVPLRCLARHRVDIPLQCARILLDL